MEKKIFIVRAADSNGNVIGETRYTDEEHLSACVENIKRDFNTDRVFVNHASMCFDGYFVNGNMVEL